MMDRDKEMEAWRSEWMAQPLTSIRAPAELRRKAVRQQTSLRIRHVLEILTGAVLLAFSALVARRNPGPEAYLWAGIVWLGTAVAIAFSLWNWQILWSTDLKSVTEFTQFYRKRSLAELRAVRFGRMFLVIQLLIVLPWLSFDYAHHQLSGSMFGASVFVLIAFTAGFVFLFQRMKTSSLQQLNELRELDQECPGEI